MTSIKVFSKKTISVILSLLMILTVIPSMSLTASAATAVSYLDTDGTIKYADAEAITDSTDSLTSGWYAVTENVENSNRINVSGDVDLILCNGATLTAHMGIKVNENCGLTIWQQADAENAETGKLLIDQVKEGSAGIEGSATYTTTSSITINGGNITANGGNCGAGIGSGMTKSSGEITINGGTVNATGGYKAAGIGSGYYNGICGAVTISGGTVNATGGYWAAGIGTGESSSCGVITISGGTINATGGERGPGIGSGAGGGAADLDLTWTESTKDSMSVTVSYYGCTVNLKKDFVDNDGTFHRAKDAADRSELVGKTLVPYEFAIVNLYDLNGALNDSKEFEIGEEFTVYTILDCSGIDEGKIISISAGQSYTDSVLEEIDEQYENGAIKNPSEMFPVLMSSATGKVDNGSIRFVASTPYVNSPFYFDSDSSMLIVSKYKVISGGNADITNSITSLADSQYDRIISKGEILISDFMFHCSFSPSVPEYTVIWKNGDDVLETDENVKKGSKPVYNGETPTKAEDEDFTYTFSGWTDGENIYGVDDTLPAVSGDKVYSATFFRANKADAVSYVDASGTEQEAVACYVPVKSDTTSMSESWYVVNKDVEINTRISCSGEVNLILCNGATLTAHKGIQVEEGNSLTIWQQAKEENIETGKLLIDSCDYAQAGIGGSEQRSAGTITVNGGNIDATGGTGAAGIGSGFYNSGCESITVNGGTVKATGGWSGAGIGSGYYYSSCESITVNGGTVNATGGGNGAGIGSGDDHCNCKSIIINGGTVNATGGNGTGIGTGFINSGCESITINGGTVNAIGGSGCAGIGSGKGNSNCESITINGGTINAAGGKRAAGIGSGNNSSIKSISINGGTVNATGSNGAGIGNVEDSSGAEITLDWTEDSKDTFSVTASSYSGVVELKKSFTDGKVIYAATESADNDALAGKTLVPYYTYTIIFKNGDQTLEIYENVVAGTTPVYEGDPPTKPDDDEFIYTFSGWTDGENTYAVGTALPEVEGDVTYTAVFDSAAKHQAGYYVVGTMIEWKIDDTYLLVQNTEAQGDEFMLNDVALTSTDVIKVVKYEAGKDWLWYPSGTGNNYAITADGTYDIYFRPNADGGDDWYEHVILAVRQTPAESVAVIDMINALPEVITLDDKTDVENAREAYEALNDDQKSFIDADTLAKLTNAEEVISDREAAKAVEDMINALPENITLDEKADVEAARAALDNLTPAQAEYVTMIAIDKLFTAEDKIADLEAASDVDAKINALPDSVTYYDKADVEAARAAYEALTDDQKALIDADTLAKLTDAETALAAAEKAAADQAAADAVVDAFNALPTEVTVDDKDDIEAARAAYDALTDDQKALIDEDTYKKLTDAETALAAAEKAAADQVAADAVVDAFNALPTEVTVDDKDTIEAARAAYDALTDDQKALIDAETLAKLTDAETALAAAEKAAADQAAADAVVDAFNALPTEVTVDDKDDIEAARAAYDALTDDQKALIDEDTYKKLTDAETALAAAEKAAADQVAADAVVDAFNALPTEVTVDDKDTIEAARAAYDALTDDQKALIDEETYKKLTDAETALAAAEKAAADQAAADAVVDAFNALPTNVTVDDKDTIEAARAAYDALTDDQKALIDEATYKKLTDAETALAAAEKAAADQAAADAVVDAFNALPTEVTVDDKDTIEAARAAYDALTDDQKALIDEDTYKKLTDAETALAAAEKAAADQAAADAVVDAFNALPTEVTVDDKETIEAARAAYDALTDDQKALIDEDTYKKLTDAEDAYEALPLLGDTDGDGEVTILDATAIQRYLASLPNETFVEAVADTDGDGSITILDATHIQRWLANIDDRFPIGSKMNIA